MFLWSIIISDKVPKYQYYFRDSNVRILDEMIYVCVNGRFLDQLHFSNFRIHNGFIMFEV